MTFLEALNWMSESEENVAVRYPSDESKRAVHYCISDGKLKFLSGQDWQSAYDSVNVYMTGDWAKVIPEEKPEEVEVVAYSNDFGDIELFQADSNSLEQQSAIKSGWRKVKVRFS